MTGTLSVTDFNLLAVTTDNKYAFLCFCCLFVCLFFFFFTFFFVLLFFFFFFLF